LSLLCGGFWGLVPLEMNKLTLGFAHQGYVGLPLLVVLDSNKPEVTAKAAGG
jgi:hypothetical protein